MSSKELVMLENAQDQAVFDLIDTLISQGKVVSTADFCEQVGMFKQAITEIKKGMRHFNVKQIGEICERFNVNANYVFGFSGNKFRSKPRN